MGRRQDAEVPKILRPGPPFRITSLLPGTSISFAPSGFGKALLLLIPLLLLGCRDQVTPQFEAEGSSDGGRGVARNQPVLIRFSQPLSERMVPARALSVRDASGRRVLTDVDVDGRHLIIKPRGNDLDGGWPRWPQTAHLDINLPVPIAGPGFQSATGQLLKKGLQIKVPVHPTSARLPGFLRLVSSQPADGTRDVSMGATANRRGEKWFDIKLRFNAPLDPSTVETGIQVIDEERKLRIASAKLSPIDHGLAVIQLFVGGLQRFNADTTYQVILNRDLRSRDGRPLAAEQRISFHTAKEGTRLLQINFDERSDFDSASQFAWDAATRNLRLRTRDDIVVTLGDGKTEQVSLDDVLSDVFPEQDASEIAHVFSKKPSRSQFLIPGAWIGREPRLITGITFLTKGPVLPGTRAAEMVVVIGTLNPNKDPAVGLTAEFDQNCVDGQVMTLDGGENGYDFYAALTDEERRAQPTPGNGRGEHPSVANLNFSAPYLYPGGAVPLVVEIRNQSGVLSPNESMNANGGPGVIVRGAKSQQSEPAPPNTLALGERSAATAYHPFPKPFVLRLGLKTKVFPPAVSRWYIVDDVDSPKFQSTLSNDDIGCGPNLQLHRDFLVEFQSGIPMLDARGNPVSWPDGSPRCTPSGPSNAWSPYPPDDGRPAIRVRVRFIPRWYTPGEEPPEIEYILMHYEDRS